MWLEYSLTYFLPYNYHFNSFRIISISFIHNAGFSLYDNAKHAIVYGIRDFKGNPSNIICKDIQEFTVKLSYFWFLCIFGHVGNLYLMCDVGNQENTNKCEPIHHKRY